MKRVAGGSGKPRERSPRPSDSEQRIAVARTPGARAAIEWFEDLGLSSDKPWYVEISIDVVDRPAMATYSGELDTRFHINIYPEEWGVFFCHQRRASWVRVTDQPFVHGRDDYHLISELPPLPEIGQLVQDLERKHDIVFQRGHALVRTNVTGGKPALRKWLSEL